MNYYSEAIKILSEVRSMDASADADDMLFEIARKNPSLIIKSYNVLYEKTIEQKILEFSTSVECTSKISCIKLYRELTGDGLKESKLAVERIINDELWINKRY